MADRGMTVLEHDGDSYFVNDSNIADEFSESKDYLMGDQVYHEGELFRFKNNHSAGAWNNSHVTLVRVGRDIRDMNRMLNPVRATNSESILGRHYPQPLVYEQGSLNDKGKPIDSSTRIRTNVFYVGDSNMLKFTLTSGYKYEVDQYGENYDYIGNSGFVTSSESVLNSDCRYVIVLLAKTDNSSISPSDGSNMSIVLERFTHPVYALGRAVDKVFRETGIVQDLDFSKNQTAGGGRLARRACTDYIRVDGDFEVFDNNGINSLAFMVTIYDENFTDLGDIGSSVKEYNGWIGVLLANHPSMRYVKVWCLNKSSESTALTDRDVAYANEHIKLVHGHLIKEPEDVAVSDFLIGFCPDDEEFARTNTTGRCTSNCYYKNRDLLITNAAGKSIGIRGHLAFYDADFNYLGDSGIFENYTHPSDSSYPDAPYYKIVMGENYPGDIDLSVIESFVSWMTVGENLMHKFTVNGSTGVPYYVNASRCCTLDMIWVEDAYIKNIYPALDLGIAVYSADKTFEVAYDWFTYSSDYGRTDRAIRLQHKYVRFYFCKENDRTGDFSKADFHQYSRMFMEGKLVEITDSVGAHAIGEEIRNGYPYYYNGEMKATVDTLCSKESYGAVKFALISDLHDNDKTHLNETIEKQVMAIRDIAKKNGLHFVICGGDLTDGNETLTKSEVLEKMTAQVRMFKEIGVPVLFLRGNHDDNSYASYEVENVISRQEFYARCMAPFGGKIIQDGKCYYYQDFDEVNTRVICLDYIDYPWIVDDGSIVYGAGGSNIWRGYSDEQIAWLLGTALNCNKRIIVTGHYTTHPNIMTNYEKGKDTNYTIVKQALEAYNARGSVTFGGNTYSFAEKTGKVLIQATAHSHSFGAFKDNGIVWASTGSASAEVTNRTNGYDNIPPYETMLSRTYGDITEAHFNVFSCDDSNVHIVSFGQMGNLDFEV